MGPIYDSMKKHFKWWLIGLLALLNVVTGMLLYNGRHDLTVEKAAHQRDIKSYKDAQAQAEDKVKEVTEQLTEKGKQDAKTADQSYATLNAKYRSTLLRYQTLERTSSGPGSSVPVDTTKGGNGNGGDTELPAALTISGDDARICAVNTARLQAIQEWADTLKEGTE